MSDGDFCFFHTDVRLRRKHRRIPLPILEDANAIQVALSQLAARIMDDTIDLKRSGQLLYLLQVASQNVQRTRFEHLMESIKRASALDYTPAMVAELMTVPGNPLTPRALADIEEMKKAAEKVRGAGGGTQEAGEAVVGG